MKQQEEINPTLVQRNQHRNTGTQTQA